MKLDIRHSSLLLLVLPALAAAASGEVTSSPRAALDYADKRHDVPTKDAPVDGKDGKPHLGPFVDTDGAKKTDAAAGSDATLPVLKGRPEDPTKVDGQKIPKSNDGVMFDKNRDHAESGITGLEGGMSEKAKAKQAEEQRTGEKATKQPTAPKENRPLSYTEEQKIKSSNDKDGTTTTTTTTKDDETKKTASGEEGKTDYTGLEKPDDLPSRPKGQPPPIPDSVIKNMDGKAPIPNTPEEGLIQPFHSFVLSFAMILFSEIGDKTFLVAALMAMKHDRMVVFTAAFGALLVMTVLSAVLGHTVPALIPKRITSFLAAALFFVFGARLMREGLQMDPNEGVTAEMHEVEQELAEKEKEMGRKRGDSVSAYALEMGLDGNGNDGPRRSRTGNRLLSPPRSPSQSPVRGAQGAGEGIIGTVFQGTSNLFSLLLSPAWVQTFVMTFLGEWGDRSQIATIAMAAGQDYWWVTLGAMCGHAICTGVAVIGGRAIAGRVSLKVVTVGGAGAFLVFGVIYLLEAIYA